MINVSVRHPLGCVRHPFLCFFGVACCLAVCNNVLSFVDVCMFEPKGARERREIVSAGVAGMSYQAPAFLDSSKAIRVGA